MTINLKGKLTLPDAKRTFVIGSIHGDLGFIERLERAGFDRGKDRVVSTGNIIDFGSNSRQVLELLNEPWFFSVIGSHEIVPILTYLESEDDRGVYLRMMPWLTNGGSWFLLNSGVNYSSYQYDKTRFYESINGLRDLKLHPIIDIILNKMPVFIEFNALGKKIGISHKSVPDLDWGVSDSFNYSAHSITSCCSPIHKGKLGLVSRVDEVVHSGCRENSFNQSFVCKDGFLIF